MTKLYVVGLGPGGADFMTPQADAAIEACDSIYGYKTYIDLIRDRYPHKTMESTGMREETARCKLALEEAAGGRTTAMVCSGDPGVYGMAGLICELAVHYPDVEVEVVPGITAATAGAALLGAPLGHDFAVISLSDLLTSWEQIEKRLRAAASADLIICLYNPSSSQRYDYLARACDILLEVLPADRTCGIARMIGREDESCRVLTLGALRETAVDMFTTVFIGSEGTKAIGHRMVTSRGYRGVR